MYISHGEFGYPSRSPPFCVGSPKHGTGGVV
nr:MAG TPA: hypothetical protein [Caudoviricetes sp.]